MRIIARLDIKNEWVIKGIQMEGLRKIGEPVTLAKKYYEAGVHEIIFMDAVASLYDRNNLFHLIEKACEEVFVPICIGGGLRSLEDISMALAAGADKVAINTAALKNIALIREIAGRFGSQCIVGSIEAKRQADGAWQAYMDNGREPTGRDVVEWAVALQDAGVGEILLTSVDRDGTKRGFDHELLLAVQRAVSRPVILSGGFGEPKHLEAMSEKGEVPSAIAIGSALHYQNVQPSVLLGLLADRTAEDIAA